MRMQSRKAQAPKEVNIWWVDGYPNDVRVACSWYGWNVVPMKQRKEGVWHLAQKLTSGVYEFKFVVDGMWRLSNNYNCTKKLDEKLNHNFIRISGSSKRNDGKKGCAIM